MSENQPSQIALIQKLLDDRDKLYQQVKEAQARVAELTDKDASYKAYEASIAAKDADLKVKDAEISRLGAVIGEKDEKIQKLISQLEYLKRKLWGKMSEKSSLPNDPRQLEIDFGEGKLTEEEKNAAKAAAQEVEADREARKVTVRSYEKKVPVRKPFSEKLRREYEELYPEGYEGHEDEWTIFEETEKSEHLEFTPPDIWVRVTIRHKGKHNPTGKIRTAKLPVWPIARSYATSSLLAELTCGKYFYHIPFYRQRQIFSQLGFEIPQPTIESWFHEVADLMRPLYYEIEKMILAEDYVESDETTIPIVNNEKKKAVKGYLWLARAILKPLVIFHYHNGSRSKNVALGFFREYQGAIQVDGYAGYDILDKLKGIIILCCWAHARRYFDRALNHDKERAEYALYQISLLYSVETMADEANMSYEERARLRQRLSYPIIKALEAWGLTEYNKVLPQSPIGRAINYMLTHIKQLSRYTMDGRYRIDNNLVENAVRPVAVGRKGYLFCGNHDAAEDAAVIYTRMGCCRLADVDPKKWAKYFFDHVHDYDDDYSKDLTELLPHRLKEAGLL